MLIDKLTLWIKGFGYLSQLFPIWWLQEVDISFRELQDQNIQCSCP